MASETKDPSEVERLDVVEVSQDPDICDFLAHISTLTPTEEVEVEPFEAHPVWWAYQDDIGAAGLAVREKGHTVPDTEVIGVIADAIARRLHSRITRDLRNGELFITPFEGPEADEGEKDGE